jgi:serine/threonine protein kinase
MTESAGTSPLLDSLDSSTGSAFPDQGMLYHPREVGPYRILSVLGEGGMGTVYAAEQSAPVRRRVAVKLIKLGMDTRDVIARFASERQALALMSHPNIAQVFEAGAGSQGQPYFVMELVDGVSLTRYCDAHSLSTGQRLELFAQVCDAVQHAHTKGVIHRDLKPGNVLVTEVDGRPVPKVIDFGVAKAVDQRSAEKTLFTQAGRMVGTPEYMSPEQAGPTSAGVDARTDVYSLGVMLYELLTGALPFEAASLRSAALAEVQRIIREVEPMRPSTRVTSMPGVDALPLARRRQETVATLAGALRRELEWVPMKAMRKDRDHRYRTASELADDVRNYLAGRPLIAGPETRTYLARKFLRRHRGPAVALAALASLLLGGVAATAWQATRATRAERVARRESDTAQRRFEDVRALASRMLSELLPEVGRLAGSTPATRRLVDMSLQYLSNLQAEASGDVPLMQDVAKAYTLLGDVQGNPYQKNIGDVPSAMQSYQRATDMLQRALAVSPRDAGLIDLLATADLKTGDVLELQGLRDQAVARYTAARTLYEQARTLKPDEIQSWSNPISADQRLAFDRLERGDVDGAVASFGADVRAAKAAAQKFPVREARDLVPPSLRAYANAQGRAAHFADAVVTLREEVALLEASRAQYPDDAGVQAGLAEACNSLAYMLLNQASDAAGAVEPMALAVSLFQHACDADPTDFSSLSDLAHALILQKEVFTRLGRYDEAGQAVQHAIDLLQRALLTAPSNGSIKKDLVVALGTKADLLEKRQDFAGSLGVRRQAIDLLNPLAAADPQNMTLQAGLAYVHREMSDTSVALQDFAAAAAEAREAVSIEERLVGQSPDDVGDIRGLIVSRRSLVTALDGIVTAPASTAAERAAARAQGRPLLYEIRREVDQLERRNAFSAENRAVYRELDQAERDFADPPPDRPKEPSGPSQPATAPGR